MAAGELQALTGAHSGSIAGTLDRPSWSRELFDSSLGGKVVPRAVSQHLAVANSSCLLRFFAIWHCLSPLTSRLRSSEWRHPGSSRARLSGAYRPRALYVNGSQAPAGEPPAGGEQLGAGGARSPSDFHLKILMRILIRILHLLLFCKVLAGVVRALHHHVHDCPRLSDLYMAWN